MATVKKVNVSSKRVSSEIDLFSDLDQPLPKDVQEEIKEDVGNFLKEQIILSLAEAKSPVSGESFKALSKSYKAEKTAEGLPGIPNLERTGKMLDALDFVPTKDGVEIGVFGEAAERAEGHNNFRGDSTLPQRRFLPNIGQTFKREVQSEIDKIIRDKSVEQLQVTRADVAEISDQSELFDFLKDLMPEFTKTERVDAVLRNSELRDLLDEFNLLRFLRG